MNVSALVPHMGLGWAENWPLERRNLYCSCDIPRTLPAPNRLSAWGTTWSSQLLRGHWNIAAHRTAVCVQSPQYSSHRRTDLLRPVRDGHRMTDRKVRHVHGEGTTRVGSMMTRYSTRRVYHLCPSGKMGIHPNAGGPSGVQLSQEARGCRSGIDRGTGRWEAERGATRPSI